ncbi:MAG: SPASM domain-containing protein, partial [Candidatus Thorarchaeota archaeon]
GMTVWTHFVPMQPNIDHIKKTRDLCVNLGVSKMSLLRFVPQTRGFANKDALLPSMEMFDKMQKAIDYEMTHPDRKDLPTAIRAGCPADFRHATAGTSIYEASTGKTKSCHAGTDLILVRPDGTVHPCAAWKSLPTDSNVRERTLHDVWAGDTTYNAIRHYLQEGWEELEGACGTCSALDSCRGGCPAQRLHAFGRKIDDLYFPEADPLCPTRLYDLERHHNNDGLKGEPVQILV